jgi:hypothetical protein
MRIESRPKHGINTPFIEYDLEYISIFRLGEARKERTQSDGE